MSLKLKTLAIYVALCCGTGVAVGDQGKRNDARDRTDQEHTTQRELVGQQRRAALRATLRDQRQANRQGARQAEMRQLSPEERMQLRQQLRQQRQDAWRQPQ